MGIAIAMEFMYQMLRLVIRYVSQHHFQKTKRGLSERKDKI